MKTEICPFCKKPLPTEQNLCLCGAYRVTEETYDLPLKEQPYYTPEIQQRLKMAKT